MSRRPGPPARPRLTAWAELLRVPALFTVPGDALAGAAAVAPRPGPRTLLAVGSSLLLYEAGMALNDWADRHEDAAERPHRPLPSGRIRPAAALAAAGALTGAGLALAARAGRPALAVAVPLAGTVWAYDLALKHTPAGPAAMAAARSLDLLLGAAATAGRTREALAPAALLGAHTLAVTAVSRQEARGGSSRAPLAALTATGVLTHLLSRRRTRPRTPGEPARSTPAPGPAGHPHHPFALPAGRGAAAAPSPPGPPPAATRTDAGTPVRTGTGAAADPRTGSPAGTAGRAGPGRSPAHRAPRPAAGDVLPAALAVAYAATAGRPYLHAALNPSPPLTQRAVGGGIRAMIPLQAALAARSGARATALLTAALAPAARRFARKVSIT
ncbi:SCO3242 family prenyltransferase [Streptomyces sp. NPDC006193]|uniref:SCO3242 family prenyltransferase n=1 Tax=Streptomyces sp. NPDC006193 TaxID=3155717 RepID=UPI0033BCE66B